MKKMSYLCTANSSSATAQKPRTARTRAPVAELVDASDLGSGVVRRAGSSPVRRTKPKKCAFFMQKLPEKGDFDRKLTFFFKKIKFFLHN